MKRCFKCKIEKDESEFYKKIDTYDGLDCWCKKCNNEKRMRYLKTKKGREVSRRASINYYKTIKGKITNRKGVVLYRLRHPEKVKSLEIFHRAIRYKKIIRPDYCSQCFKTCVPEGHHEDYSKPLEVIWVCHQCHSNIHKLKLNRVESLIMELEGK